MSYDQKCVHCCSRQKLFSNSSSQELLGQFQPGFTQCILEEKLSCWFVQMCNGKERKCRNNNSPQVGIEPGASRFKIQQSTKWAKEISHWRSASSSTDKPQPLQNEWLSLLQRKTVTKDENSKQYLKFQCFLLIDWLPSLIYWVKDSFSKREAYLLNHCERQLLAHLAQSIFRGREFKIVQMNGSLLCKGR